MLAAVGLGIVLRLIWPSDMEYKFDEHYAYVHALPATPALLGQQSSVEIPNPGMGEWVFWLIAHLERVLSGGTPSPVALDRGVMLINALTLVALVAFVLKVVSARGREPWLYATALLAVNPVAILFSRKLWIQCLLAPFALAMLFAWWRRRTRGGAFAWGVLGLWLGQIHMTGLFLAPAVVLWTALFDRRSVRWRWWLAGCAVGAVTLIPWLLHVLSSHSVGAHNFAGILGSNGNFWYYWLATPIGRPLLTSSELDRDTARVAATRRRASASGGPRRGCEHRRGGGHLRKGFSVPTSKAASAPALRSDRVRRSDTTSAVSAAVVGFGILLTASGVLMYRHYVTVAFILPFLFLALAGVRAGRVGPRLLTIIIIAQAVMSVGYLGEIHTNRGAPGGDYGYAYDSPECVFHGGVTARPARRQLAKGCCGRAEVERDMAPVMRRFPYAHACCSRS